MGYPPLPEPDSRTGEVHWGPPAGPINADWEGPFSLMIARFPGNFQEHPDSSGWVMKLLGSIPMHQDEDGLGKVMPNREVGTPIPMLRNLTVWKAIKANADYLLMIDSDMSPDCVETAPGFFQTAWDFLMNRRERERLTFMKDPWEKFAPATIAAPYCGASPEQPVCVLRWVEAEGNDHPDRRMKLMTIDRHDAARRSGIEKVAAMGTGLILYDVRTFFYLPPPWFAYEYTDGYQMDMNQAGSTEDVKQTRDAALLGMPQYVAWDCWAGHHKLQKIGKPRPITGDIVNATLRDAIRRNMDATLLMVHPDDPNR